MIFVNTSRAMAWRWPNGCRGPRAATEGRGCGPSEAGGRVGGSCRWRVISGEVAVAKGSGSGRRGGPGAARVRGMRGRRGTGGVSVGSGCREVATKNRHRKPKLEDGRG